MADRQRNVQIHRPIIYGTHARLLKDTERALAPAGHTHRWTIFLTSATSPPPKAGEEDDMDYLPGGADDLSYLIKKVTFRLHETYANPSRVLEKPPYKVSETGWGEFTIQIRIQFVNEASEKPLAFQHGLKLHHWGPPIEGEPLSANIDASLQPRTMSQPPVNGDASTPAVAEGSSTPAQGNPDGDVAVKAETSTPRPDVVMGDNEDTGTPAAGTPGGSQPPGAGTIETHQTRAQSLAQSAAEQRISVAAKYPVYSWQYDELVFSDPPLALFNLMNENPPTPLPAKNRRPRDQRDGFESKKKAKSGVTRNATAGSSKLAGTPIAGAVGTPAEAIKEGSTAPNVDGEGGGNGTAPGTPSAAPVVGIPGEPGSADVPLEFTNEMERAEHNKLHMARRKIIDEMDRWRSKLIEQEKELAKVKEEMQAAA